MTPRSISAVLNAPRPHGGGGGRAGAGRANDVEQVDKAVLFGFGGGPVTPYRGLVKTYVPVRVDIAQPGNGAVGAA